MSCAAREANSDHQVCRIGAQPDCGCEGERTSGLTGIGGAEGEIRRNAVNRALDGSAICLSALCLAHCLILPIGAALLPMLGAWAEAEWVHAAALGVALPLSLLAIARSVRSADRARLAGLAGFGLLLLAVGAFLAPSRAMEVALTVAGSAALASAHIWNWWRRRAPGPPLGSEINRDECSHPTLVRQAVAVAAQDTPHISVGEVGRLYAESRRRAAHAEPVTSAEIDRRIAVD
jgi:hypothetical protein